MNLAVVMLVRDESDIVEQTIRHLFDEGVDRVYATDNLSIDGTEEIILALQNEVGSDALRVGLDAEVGYYQSRKTTALAQRARDDGFDWVIPCDADEWWYSGFGSVRSVVERHDARRFDVIRAELYDHIPTGLDDPDEPDPYRRIGWRFRHPGKLPKVACRLRPDLTIGPGNHAASFEEPARRRDDPALSLRHFTWRSEDQYVRKLRNGYEAYAATDLDPSTGAHWRMFGPPEEKTWEERVRIHFRTWFYAEVPEENTDPLIYDPLFPPVSSEE